ncbi:MAG: DUF1540 domain-containing protein [bacterium]|jgi:hypothetical protein
MPQIHCSVNSCHYWKQGNICDAQEIMVTSDALGSSLSDSIDAPSYQTFGSTPVNTCMDTCCKTFVAKDSGQAKVDGVKKL